MRLLRPGLCARLIGWYAANPDEEMTRRDMCVKFREEARNVARATCLLEQRGVLKSRREGGALVYSATGAVAYRIREAA